MSNKKYSLEIEDDYLRGLHQVVEGLNLMLGAKGLAKYFNIRIGDPNEFDNLVRDLYEEVKKSKEAEAKK